MAGVAGAVTNNAFGVAGVAWSCRIMPIKVAYTTADVAPAIDYAADSSARVINMSFGNYSIGKYGPDTIVGTAVDDGFAAGVVLVATAGNDDQDTLRYPAAIDEVIAVAATDGADQRASSSNYGTWVTVAAPAVSILTTTTGGGVSSVNGTSFAAPYVSGLAALLLYGDPGLSPDSVRDRIEFGVEKLAADQPVGSGRVNVANALSLASDPSLAASSSRPERRRRRRQRCTGRVCRVERRLRRGCRGPGRAAARLARRIGLDRVARGLPHGCRRAAGAGRRSSRNVSAFTDPAPAIAEHRERTGVHGGSTMRYGLLVLGIVLCVGLSQGWFTTGYDHLTDAALSEDAHIAMDVGCQGQEDRKVRECRAMLKKLYLAGSLDPDKTLRTYCDSVRNARWGGHPAPPKVCVDRYGGWQES